MKKPSLRAVTRMVRETHEAWSHPDAGSEMATLAHWEPTVSGCNGWTITVPDEQGTSDCDVVSDHSERLGAGKIDAVAIARRMIAGLPKGWSHGIHR